MTDSLIIPCPHCNGLNRVPGARLGDAPQCGRCKQPVISGKPLELSAANYSAQLKGDLPLLIDVWASWCGPCRGENPNVVAAYNQFKDKNFTVLGVSLDENKDKWLQAIKADNLSWKQVSDLKGWQNATVKLYGYDGIPYNVLLDPQGKIIATSLRETALQNKLAEVLK